MKSMTKKTISAGAMHSVQRIYEKFSFLTRRRWQNGRILRDSRAMRGSAGLSPSRNRKPEEDIERVRTELKEGMRRPCCWPGCPHRRNKDGGLLFAISRSVTEAASHPFQYAIATMSKFGFELEAFCLGDLRAVQW